MTSMPPRLHVAFVATMMILMPPARAQGVTAEGVVRSASLYAAIVAFCPETQSVDLELSTKAAKAMTDAANEAIGRDAGPSKLNHEFERRFDEVRAQGAVAWCAHQARQPAVAPLFKRVPPRR